MTAPMPARWRASSSSSTTRGWRAPDVADGGTDDAARIGQVDVEAYLRDRGHDELVTLVMEAAEREAGLWELL